MSDRTRRRNRSRTIAVSDELFEEIKIVAKDCVSVSSFVRMAVIKELEVHKRLRSGDCG